jgi:regulator of replication initiation timing
LFTLFSFTLACDPHSWHHLRGTLSKNTRFTRMAKQAVARAVDLDPIDRLEEKLKLLVDMVTRLRSEQIRAAEENARLMQEINGLRSRLADADDVQTELSALRDERDVIRTRVSDMLEQLEHLSM